MALVKEEVWDKIEVVGVYKALQLRKKIIIKEDGVQLNSSNWRYPVSPDKNLFLLFFNWFKLISIFIESMPIATNLSKSLF